MYELIQNWLLGLGVEQNLSIWLGWAILIAGLIAVAMIAKFITRRVVLRAITFFVRRTATKWDDALLQRHFFSRLAHFTPAIIFYFGAPLFPAVAPTVERIAMDYMILTGLFVVSAFLSAVEDVYATYSISRQKPIKGYVQLTRIILFIFVGIIALATLMNRSPWLLLSGLGAMTAVILLIFRDSILGLVASVQLSSNDMVRIGDWIEMPKYGADGDVIDVTLNTVKVRNWDKTITTIPAYQLISDSFKNWRGMTESGGRRIKRAVNIDMAGIKFCDKAMLDRFEEYQLLAPYIRQRRKEIAEYNKTHDIDTRHLINGRNMTNIGTFRAYVAAYLHSHPKIHQDMTFLIRHLPPGENGLPIEIYVFSNDQEWANFEAIQADIFDHILAVLPLFDLRVFQRPSGYDFRGLADLLKAN